MGKNYNMYQKIASTAAPSLIGCALGILASKRIKKKIRTTTAFSLLSIGFISSAPSIISYISSTLNSPKSDRGSKKRLEGIRASGQLTEEIGENIEYLESYN